MPRSELFLLSAPSIFRDEYASRVKTRLKIVFIYFVVILFYVMLNTHVFKIELRLKLRILNIKIRRNVEIVFLSLWKC